MARRRASMREGPLAELFRATEAAQRQAEKEGREPQPEPTEAEQQAAAAAAAPVEAPAPPAEPKPTPVEPPEQTVEHVPEWEEAAPPPPPPPPPDPVRLPERAPEPKREERPRPKLEPLPEPPPRLHRVPEPGAYIAVIRVVGVGGAGLNAVNRMIDADISQVEFVAVNTDIQQLQTSDAPVKIHIGRELTEGLGSGADPDLGRRAAEEAYDQIKRTLRGSDMVFVTAGEGGGTGSGAAPVVARIAKELGALTVGIVTTPFQFEGTRRRKQADDGVDTLRANCDTVIVVPNERLLEVLDRETSMLDAFRIADDVLRQGVQGICDLITLPGLINLDFADVRTIMKDAGTALMGIGFSATGDNRARDAAERALRSPLIENDIGGAKGILLSIAGGDDLSLFEVNEAAEVVRSAATDDTNIIFGASVDDRLTGQVWVTVVATGFGQRAAQRRITIRAEARDEDSLEPPSFLQS
ncbi:MAG TPA: cell division protein FtsZ [Gaiellaceae bacterium]|nr:cell division protein FtsZ [Gaiellaceae bacterium]